MCFAVVCIISYAKDNKKIHIRNHIIGISLLYIIYSVIEIWVLTEILNIVYAFEVLIFRGLIFIEVIVFVIMSQPPKKIEDMDDINYIDNNDHNEIRKLSMK